MLTHSNFYRFSFAWLFMGLFLPAYLSAQDYLCATPDISYADLDNLTGDVVDAQIAGSAAWNIPVWIYVVRQDGESWVDDQFAPQQYLESTNAYFDNGMGFYMCGLTSMKTTGTR